MKSVIWLIAAVSVMVFSVSDMNAQDVANGKKVYEGYCKTCHQANGQGMPKIYPPLAKSDYTLIKRPASR